MHGFEVRRVRRVHKTRLARGSPADILVRAGRDADALADTSWSSLALDKLEIRSVSAEISRDRLRLAEVMVRVARSARAGRPVRSSLRARVIPTLNHKSGSTVHRARSARPEELRAQMWRRY